VPASKQAIKQQPRSQSAYSRSLSTSSQPVSPMRPSFRFALLACSPASTAAPGSETFDLSEYVVPPMDIMYITSFSNSCHCNPGQRYCFTQITNDLGSTFLAPTCAFPDHVAGYPIDQSIYTCSTAATTTYSTIGCQYCKSTGCRCLDEYSFSIFECKNRNNWYELIEICDQGRPKGPHCIAGMCY
jgi:hypothetical protein